MQTTDPRTAAGQLSPDGLWRWDGMRWVPASAGLPLPPMTTPTPIPGAPPRRSTLAVIGGIAGIAAIPFILAGCFLPFIYYSDTSGGGVTSSSVFNLGFPGTAWFAAEPVAVMVFSIAPAIVLLVWSGRLATAIASGALIAFGVQTFFLFIGYTGGDLTLGRIGAGGPLGLVGGFVMLSGGVLAAASLLAKAPAQQR